MRPVFKIVIILESSGTFFMSDELLVVPVLEPVSLSDVKSYLRIFHDVDDSLLESLIITAREWCEELTSRAFITQTRQMILSVLPKGREIVIKRGPLQSVQGIVLYGSDETETNYSLNNIIVDTAHIAGRLVLKDGAVWPVLQRAANGLSVTYVAGYGDEADDVPAAIRLAIKQLVADWYENREVVARSSFGRVPMTVEALLQTYRVVSLSCV